MTQSTTWGQEQMAVRSEIVHCYEQLAACISTMLALARAKEWGQLPELEARCAAWVERLKTIQPLTALEPAQRDFVLHLLERICREQAELSGLIKPQLDDLVRRMDSLNHQKNLGKAYGLSH
ncbi:flagellar protein FliT [Acidovorax cavernicola]|uniref:flagellar protein FliT n=1 Tax=Acidovorax cavernicola TaxID=1675792 RepID=UPI0025706684|nr:flagellar protein FliT [Acidovorax cavernicola]